MRPHGRRPGPAPRGPSAAEANDRRGRERKRCDQRATVRQVNAAGALGERLSARLTNLSKGALGLWSERDLLPGVSLLIEIEGAPPDRPAVFFGIVMRTRKVATGGHALGVVLREPPAFLGRRAGIGGEQNRAPGDARG